MYHLVPILSSVLFVFTQAFHVFYPDQAELVELNPKEYSLLRRRFIFSILINLKDFILKFRQNNYFGLVRFLEDGQVSFIITVFAGAQRVLWILSTQLSHSLRAALAT